MRRRVVGRVGCTRLLCALLGLAACGAPPRDEQDGADAGPDEAAGDPGGAEDAPTASDPGAEADARPEEDGAADAGDADDADAPDDAAPDCACFDPWSAPSLTCDEVQLAMAAVPHMCFPPATPFECYPHELGLDERNGRMVEASYSCSDLCPTYGRVDVVYAGVDEDDCDELGGDPQYDEAWYTYVGCAPGACVVYSWSCEDSWPGAGTARGVPVWRTRAEGEWPAGQSGGLGVVGETVLVGLPRDDAVGALPPSLLRFSAVDGTRLAGPPEMLAMLDGVRAVTAVPSGSTVDFLGALPSAGDVVTVLAQRLDETGATVGVWSMAGSGESDPMTSPSGVNAAADGSWRFAVVEGRTASGAQTLAALSRELGAGTSWTLPSERIWSCFAGFVAAGGTRVVWSLGEHFLVTDYPLGSMLDRTMSGAPRVPIASVGSDLLAASYGRGPLADLQAIVISQRSGIDLERLSSDVVPEAGAPVGWPRPKAIAAAGSGAVLAWTSTLRSDPLVPECLYVTPLDVAGSVAGPSMRIDAPDASGERVAIENVRIAARGSEVYVMWRRGADLWLTRLDLSW